MFWNHNVADKDGKFYPLFIHSYEVSVEAGGICRALGHECGVVCRTSEVILKLKPLLYSNSSRYSSFKINRKMNRPYVNPLFDLRATKALTDSTWLVRGRWLMENHSVDLQINKFTRVWNKVAGVYWDKSELSDTELPRIKA